MQKWILFIIGALLAACSAGEQIQELRLSVAEETVYTDGIEYSFDIVSGSGDYQVTVEDNNRPSLPAKATIKGNHVKVDLFIEQVALTITDRSNQEIRLLIVSSSDAIKICNYDMSLYYGSMMKRKLSFGTGKYSVLSQSGHSAEVYFDANDQIIIKSLQPGISYFLIGDQRGTTNNMIVRVGNGSELTSDKLTVTTEGDQYITFPLKYGEGGWKIISPLLHDPQICVMPKDEYHEQDMLLVFAAKENKEPMVFELRDKADNRATITIHVE